MRSKLRAPWQLATLLCLVCALACPPGTLAQGKDALHGVIRDAHEQPVAGATVSLVDASGSTLQTTTSGREGHFDFEGVAPGTYRLRGTLGSTAGEVTVSAPVATQVTLVLASQAPNAGPTFFDQPTFTVAGVTDTSNLAIHGSANVAHQKDALTKEVVNLADLPIAAAPATGRHSPAFAAAEKLIAAKEYAQARSLLTKDLQTQEDAGLRRLLGDADEQLGDPVQAVRQYQRAAELDPTETNLLRWGAEFLLHHAPDPALQIFTEGTRRFPSSSRMLTALGVAYYIRGSYEKATELLCRASDLDPHSAEPYLFLGRIAESEPTISGEAQEHLARFVHASPGNAQANYYYAIALTKQRSASSLADAQTYLEKAIRLDPTFAAAHLQLGILFQEGGETLQAIANLQHAVALQPDLADAHFRLAQLYRKAGEGAQSRAELAKYQELTTQANAQAERERHEIQQFVLATRDGLQK